MSGSDVEVVVALLAFRDEFKDIGTLADVWLSLEASTDCLEDVIARDLSSVGDIVDGEGRVHLDA
jgi:hypothetical protein